MNWAKLSQQNCAMLLLDFEKAYDRVEWNFISMTLEDFGFPTRFCNLVKMMMNDVFAHIDINGSLSDAFLLGRSIKQGCPLAPALFVISSEAFHYILRDHSMSPAIRGIRLPNNEELITSQFADDTTIFFEARDSNFEAL
ncbi:secreted RxLR effector protein 78-like [Cryptomeria japonica]|uniref:secreted RxLR effector protein 78-like n=1 Tax=Cryptomeria japonica TaxID=3369 RepID=UPI0027DA958B|nr:secreted RxLR effector protein 78-like [Cryptomeria japonica]